jgi:hypothetical protein
VPLKEDIIELLQKNPDIYNPNHFMLEGEDHALSFDLVGLIFKVSRVHLQTDHNGSPRLPLNAPEVEKKWLDYEDKAERTLEEFRSIPALARQLWAAKYGDREAMQLPFYDEAAEGEVLNCYWDDMDEVTDQDIISVLQGGEPDNLNEYAPEDE